MYFEHGHHKRRSNPLSGFFGFIFYSVLSAIIFLLIYSFFFTPGMTSDAWEVTKDTVSDLGDKISGIPKTDNLINGNINQELKPISFESKCKAQYDKYYKIGEQKYGVRYKISTIKTINNLEEANEFDSLYSGFGAVAISQGDIKVYPITAIASSSKNNLGETYPVISICDHNGDMIESSKTRLTLSFNLFG